MRHSNLTQTSQSPIRTSSKSLLRSKWKQSKRNTTLRRWWRHHKISSRSSSPWRIFINLPSKHSLSCITDFWGQKKWKRNMFNELTWAEKCQSFRVKACENQNYLPFQASFEKGSSLWLKDKSFCSKLKSLMSWFEALQDLTSETRMVDQSSMKGTWIELRFWIQRRI